MMVPETRPYPLNYSVTQVTSGYPADWRNLRVLPPAEHAEVDLMDPSEGKSAYSPTHPSALLKGSWHHPEGAPGVTTPLESEETRKQMKQLVILG